MLEGYVVVVKLIISIPQKYIDWKVMEVVVGCEGDYGCSCMLIDTFSVAPSKPQVLASHFGLPQRRQRLYYVNLMLKKRGVVLSS